MGFFKSLIEEAGRKTGGAIGNKLFPKSKTETLIAENSSQKELTSEVKNA